MIRDATRYGAWAAFLALATTAIITVQGSGIPSLPVSTVAFIFLLPALPTFLAAVTGWAMLHRRGRRPGWIGYGLLATGVVIATQLIIALPVGVHDKVKPLNFAKYNILILIDHGWFTIPIALAGTVLFVRWIQRRALTPPSPAVDAGSRT